MKFCRTKIPMGREEDPHESEPWGLRTVAWLSLSTYQTGFSLIYWFTISLACEITWALSVIVMLNTWHWFAMMITLSAVVMADLYHSVMAYTVHIIHFKVMRCHINDSAAVGLCCLSDAQLDGVFYSFNSACLVRYWIIVDRNVA